MQNNSLTNITITEVAQNNLNNAFTLFSQLNPHMNFQEFTYNYSQLRNKEYHLFQANCDSRPVGLIGYAYNYDLCVGRAMYIDILVVDKRYRNKGIAKQLMTFAISKLHKDRHAKCIRWTTRNDLQAAIGFYKNKIKEPIGYYYRIDNPYFK